MSGHVIVLSTSYQRERAKRLIMGAPKGWLCNIREQTRTGEQNAKLWAMLSDVSRAKPGGRSHTPEVWKCLFMHALGHTSRFELGLNGEPFPVGFRSSQLSKSQMSDLIEFIIAWCAQNDVRLSDQSGES
jgi:hypothetical protein